MKFRKRNELSSEREHYKMYKSKKRWVYSGIVVFFVASGLGITSFEPHDVHADTLNEATPDSTASASSASPSTAVLGASSASSSSNASASSVAGSSSAVKNSQSASSVAVNSSATKTSASSASSMAESVASSSLSSNSPILKTDSVISAVSSSNNNLGSNSSSTEVNASSNISSSVGSSATNSVTGLAVSSLNSQTNSAVSLKISNVASSLNANNSVATGTTVISKAKTAMLTKMAVVEAAALTPVSASDIVISPVNTDVNGNNKLYNGYAPQASDFQLSLPDGMNVPALDPATDLSFTPGGVFGFDDSTGTDADNYTVTLTQAGLDAIAAANPTYDFSGVNVADIASTQFQVGQLGVNPNEIGLTMAPITVQYNGKAVLPITASGSVSPVFSVKDPSINPAVVDYLNGLGITIPWTTKYFEYISYTGDGGATVGTKMIHAGSYVMALGSSNSPRSYLSTLTSVAGDTAGGNFNWYTSGVSGVSSAYNKGDYPINVTVTPAPATITVNSVNTTYDGTSKSASITITGMIGTDTLSTTVSGNGQVNVGTYPVTVTVNPASAANYTNSNYAVTVTNGTITIAPAAASYTLTGDSSKIYDGNIGTPDLSDYSITLSNNETYALQADDLEVVNDSANVGGYMVQLSATGVADLNKVDPNGNYVFTQANGTSTATYEINKAPVTISGDTFTHVYDGNQVQPTVTITGAVNGETLTYAPLSTVGPNVGTYTVTPVADSTGVNANYDITIESGTITIAPSPLTTADVTITGGSKTYDGTAITAAATVTLPAGLTVPTLTQGTDYMVSGADSNLKNAGTYTVTLTTAGLAKLAATNTNYDFSGVDPTEVTTNYVINKATATISGDTFSNVYDGNQVQPTATVTGAVNGETLTYAPLAKVGPNVGSYTVTPVADTTGVDANYNIKIENGTVTITQEPVSNADVTITGGSKTYDGAAITNAATVTLPTGLTVPSLTQGTDYTVSGTDSNLKNAGTYIVTLTTAGLAKLAAANTNYDFSGVDPAEVTTNYVINKALATISGDTISHVYDGNQVQPTVTITGAVDGEALTYAPLAEVGPNVGSYTVTPVADTTGVNANYNITIENGTVTITQAPLTTADVTITGGSKVYDGVAITNAATVTLPTGLTVPALVQGTDYTVTGTDSNLKNAGTYTVTLTSAGLAKLAAANTNYDFSGVDPTEVTTDYVISKAPATISGDSISHVYDGKTVQPTVTITGAVNGETLTYAPLAVVGPNVGSYTVTPVADTTGVDANYDVTVENGTVTITQAPLTNADVTISGGNKTYDGTAITNAATVTLPTGLTVPALTQGTDYTVSGTDSNLKNAGTYTVTLTSAGLAKLAAANTNYDFSGVDPAEITTNYVINKASATISGDTISHVYDGNTVQPTATTTGAVKGETLTYAPLTAVGPNVGTYTVTPVADSTGVDANYNITIENGTVTITQAPETNADVTITDGSKTYDGAAITNAATVTLPTGLTVPALTQGTDYTVSGTDSNLKDAGTYTVTLTAAGLAKLAAANTNYDFSGVDPTKVTTNYVISKAPATISGDTISHVYDGKTVQPTVTTTGAVNNETLTYEALSPVGPNVGDYKVTPVADATGVNANYNITVVEGIITITPAPVFNGNVNITGGSKTYDGKAITNAATVTLPDGLTAPALTQGTDYTVSGADSNLKNAGTYTVTLTATGLAKIAAANTNYDFSAVNPAEITTDYVVNKANATITGDNLTHVYDGNTVQPTATVTGTVNGETLTYEALSSVGPNVGSYTITPVADSTGTDANYNIKIVNGTVTIVPMALTDADVNITGGSKTYDGKAITNAATVTLPTGLTVPALTQGTDYTVSGADSKLKNAGTYTVTLTSAGLAKLAAANTNYDFNGIDVADITTSYLVNKANAQISADNEQKVEGSADPTLNAVATGLVSGDQLNYTVVRDAGENPGTYTINVKLGDNPNYNVTTTPGVFTIQALVKVQYVDQDGNLIPGVSTENINGNVGDTITIDNPTLNGYKIMNKQPSSYVITNQANQVVNVEYRKNATVTVNYYLNGTKQALAPSEQLDGGVGLAYETSPVSLNGYTLVAKPGNASGKYTDLPTEVDYYYNVNYTLNGKTPTGEPVVIPTTPGNGQPGQPIANLPEVPGYTVINNPQVPDTPGVVDVIYAPNDEKANVTFIDDTTGKTLSVKDLTGKFGTTDGYDVETDITKYLDQGYSLVSDNYPNGGVIYNQDGVTQSFTVHFVHATAGITPENPGKPGQPIDPANPNGPKWPSNSGASNLNKKVTETIHYVYSNGKAAANDYTNSLSFTRTGTVDEVTGAVSYSDWSAAGKNSFASVASPIIKGYFASIGKVNEVNGITGNSKDISKTVVYSRMGQLVPDVPGAPTITYPNNPNDSGRPGNPIIPNIPGYTPVDANGKPLVPGTEYPINPANPGQDTTIHYIKNPTHTSDNGHHVANKTPKPVAVKPGKQVVTPQDNKVIIVKANTIEENKPASEKHEIQTVSKGRLPQTGEEQNDDGTAVGVAMLGLVSGLLALIGIRKKKN